MLPAAARVRAAADFAAVTRRGRRGSSPTVVVHLLATDRPAGARAGFVVSKKVGNSVTRHRVTRRLRHLVRAHLPELPAGTDLVIRALPPAADAPGPVLAADLDRALRHAARRAGAGPASPALVSVLVPVTLVSRLASALVSVTLVQSVLVWWVLVRVVLQPQILAPDGEQGDGSDTPARDRHTEANGPGAGSAAPPRRRPSPLAWLLIQPIRFYQRFITPYTPATCRYYPTCSSYAVGALRTHGAVKGVLLTSWRLLRCNPWSSGGIDHVPPRGRWRNPPDDVDGGAAVTGTSLDSGAYAAAVAAPAVEPTVETTVEPATETAASPTAERRDARARCTTDLSCNAQPASARAPIAGSSAA